MRSRKLAGVLAATMMTVAVLGACGAQTSNNGGDGSSNAADGSKEESGTASNFKAEKEIGVVSREDGSGTRGAFIELFGIEQKNDEGEKIDYTTSSAVITDSTAVMMTTVSGDLYSIGYISLGSLNDTVKAIQIEGADATVENIKNGTYSVSRPFNIATQEEISEVTADFISYIMSAEGQAVVEANGYITVDDEAPAYEGGMDEGKITISGSSSVTPVMEKLKEAYLELNPGVEIQLTQSDSSTGVTDAIEGTSDIGMASRDLKDSEIEQGLISTVIATDGVAVIVNNDNPVDNLTKEQVMNIYTGAVTAWDEVIDE